MVQVQIFTRESNLQGRINSFLREKGDSIDVIDIKLSQSEGSHGVQLYAMVIYKTKES